MANNPQFPGGGQFRPLVPAQQGQPFIPVPSQQFRPVGQGMPSSHVGMPAAQSQPLQFFQPIQQLPPWTNQPGPGAPSAQALSMPYVQPNRPLTSSQTQQTAPPLSNHMHGVGTSGIPISAPYALLYEEIVERAKEKEGKEAKKQQRLTNDFTKLLYTFKEVIASSNWEDCKQLFEESREYRSIGEKSLIKEIFEEYVTHLQERAKEKEHKHEEEKGHLSF